MSVATASEMSVDVGVLGGGIIGLSCAWQLANSGLRVAILERGALAQQATHAAAGMLAAQCEAAHHSPNANQTARQQMAQACLSSREMFPAWAAQLEAESGIDIELSLRDSPQTDWRTPGILYVATEANDSAPQHLQAHPHTTSTCRNEFPAYWLPDEGQVENRLFARALELSCRARDVQIFENIGDVELNRHGAHWRLQSENMSLDCERVLLCSGAWSDTLNLPFSVPVRPLCGQVLALHAGHLIHRVLYSSNVYLVPRRDGRLLVGATMEERGFDCSTTDAGRHQLLEAAYRIEPKLRSCKILDHWAGLRPATPDGLPIIGQTPLENLFIATGHGRNGILLTPQTAVWMREMLHGNHSIPDAFSLSRFD